MSLNINDLQKEKWYIISYRYNNDRYIFKFKDIRSDNSVNIYLGVCMTGPYTKSIDTWYILQGYDISEATSEEVYQYFPEEKPKNIILITNGIYVASNGNIFKWGTNDSQSYIRVLSKEFHKGFGGFTAKGARNATNEEMAWLEACEKANKFIPEEEILKSIDLRGKFKVGDKVRCIGNSKSSPHGRISYGWEKDYEFTITQITEATKDYPIAWGTKNQGGVYFDHLELVTEKVQNSSELTSLPEKWYCPYSNKEEFDRMNEFYKSGWAYVTPNDYSGCTSKPNSNNWNCSEPYGTKITFEQWKKWVFLAKKESLKEENLVGRWVKALVDYPSSGCVKKGEYGIITKDEKDALVADFPSQNNYWCEIARTNGDKYEIMPIGFDPLKQKEINQPKKNTYEIGKWYKLNNCWWAKNIRIRDGITRYEENISSSGIYNSAGGSIGLIISISEKPIDLSEIQQYLPEGHIDKMKKEKWIPKVGETVIISGYPGKWNSHFNGNCPSKAVYPLKCTVEAIGRRGVSDPLAMSAGGYGWSFDDLIYQNLIKPCTESNEFKVGDWVVVKSYYQCGEGNGISKDNLVSQLFDKNASLSASGMMEKNCDFIVKQESSYYRINKSHIIRYATGQEILDNRGYDIHSVATPNTKVEYSTLLDYGTKGGNNYTSGQEPIILKQSKKSKLITI